MTLTLTTTFHINAVHNLHNYIIIIILHYFWDSLFLDINDLHSNWFEINERKIEANNEQNTI